MIVPQRSFSQLAAPAYAQAMAARNLQLLRAIDDTLEVLAADTALLTDIGVGFDEVLQQLIIKSANQVIDPIGRVVDLLGSASDVCVRLRSRAVDQHASACADPELLADDGVAHAYADYCSAIEDLHDAIERLGAWIDTNDALLESTTGERYTSAADLVIALSH